MSFSPNPHFPVSPRRLRKDAESVVSMVGSAVFNSDNLAVIPLGSSYVVVRLAEIVDGNCPSRSAPPTILGSLNPWVFTNGTLGELNLRLAVVLLLRALVGNDCDIDAIPAALAFAKDVRPVFKFVDPLVAEADYLAWRALKGDLSAWFEFRFAISRQQAV